MNNHIFQASGLSPWLVVALLTTLAGLIGYLIRNYRRGTNNLNRREEALPWEESAVLALGRQYGGTMLQTELSEMLPMDPDQVATALKSLETRKLVERHWNVERKTFEVVTK